MAGGRRPQSVLFVCGYNSVRSPIAEVLARHFYGRSIFFASAGVRKGDPDPFAAAVIEEIGMSLGRHRPQTIEELEELEGLGFDLIITLAPEAHHKALEMTRTLASEVEYWPMPDVTLVTGNRDHILEAYRLLRERLSDRIVDRFAL